MCRNTESLEMLIVLHLIAQLVRRHFLWFIFGLIGFLVALFIWWSIHWIWQPINISHGFLTPKGYSATSMFLGQPGIFQFTSLIFHGISNQFPCLPVGKTTPWSHPVKFWKFYIFFGESSSRHWDRVYWDRVYLMMKIVLIVNFI